MELDMGVAEKAAVDVGVNFSGHNGAMAKHFLHGAKIGAAFEQVSSEGMAKNVRIDTFSNIGISSCFLDNIPYAHAAKGSTSLV